MLKALFRMTIDEDINRWESIGGTVKDVGKRTKQSQHRAEGSG